ncbi:MAG: hypothetical protein ACRD0V_00760 [Acidimicrobiales bacterium]
MLRLQPGPAQPDKLTRLTATGEQVGGEHPLPTASCWRSTTTSMSAPDPRSDDSVTGAIFDRSARAPAAANPSPIGRHHSTSTPPAF